MRAKSTPRLLLILATGVLVVTLVGVVGAAAAPDSPTAAPTNTAAPEVTGQAEQGQTLIATNGSWANSLPTGFAYQWIRCTGRGTECAAVGGATTQRYVMTSADVGWEFKIAVTASNADGSTTAVSAPSPSVTAAGSAPRSTVRPAVTGKAIDGATVASTTGAWSGTTPIHYAYQWQRCNARGTSCSNIENATSSTYVLTSVDVGNTVRSVVSAANSEGSQSAASNPSPVVAPAPRPVPASTKPASAPSVLNVASVSLPDRLVISNVQFSPPRIRTRAQPVAGSSFPQRRPRAAQTFGA